MGYGLSRRSSLIRRYFPGDRDGRIAAGYPGVAGAGAAVDVAALYTGIVTTLLV